MPTAALARPVALGRASHPLPATAVTGCAVIMTAAAGNTAGTCALLGGAVLAGQFVVGWSNDRVDVHRDRRVGHPGKPLAAGEVGLGVVDAAIAAALVATCVLSLLVGWRAGGLHLAAVAVAIAYNAVLKATWLSWLPYTVAFGAMPAVATLALPAHPGPAAWIVVLGALLGTAVNFVNALPDLAAHPLSDVHGLPDRLGGRASLVVAALLLAVASALVTAAPAGPPRPIAWAGAGLTAVLLVGGVAVLWRRASTRLPFLWLLVVAPVQIVVVVVTARPLH